MLLADIAVPVPLTQSFTYAVPAHLASVLQPGMRVACEFRRKRTIAVVLEVADKEPSFDPAKLKTIDASLDKEPCVPRELLDFLRELSQYYLAPIGEVICLALPNIERTLVRSLKDKGLIDDDAKGVGGRPLRIVRALNVTCPDPKLRGAAIQVLSHVRSAGELEMGKLTELFPTARDNVKRLASLGLVEVQEREAPTDPYFREPVPRDTPLDLVPSQKQAVEAISSSIERHHAGSYLLHGVTGSGKTEVYLRVIHACLEAGKGALVLVPEIALTPQLVARFRARFGDNLGVMHSGLGPRQRHEMWRALREARVSVAIGARSAIFAPVPNLGLVIVDEEHDASFKQEEGVRYNAKDMALLRARRAGAVCVLGSATPSLESEALVRAGKLQRLAMPDRAHATAVLPSVQLVDLRRVGPGPSGNPMLSLPLHRAIEQALAKSEQIIIFLNRRGFAPSVLCDGCGSIASCPLCSVSLTLHRAGGQRLRCHYCDYDVPMWQECESCHCNRLTLIGLGTERLEEELVAAFPSARVLRLDRDVAAGDKSEAILAKMRSRQADILVGTQMVTKGHDLPAVTVVGVVNADSALSLPDFRAAERTFQLMVQVAGRAGRAERPGKVLVQTRLPEHASLQYALSHDVAGFVQQELANRKDANYPPYARLALVRLDGPDETRVKEEAERLAEAARQTTEAKAGHAQVLGPSPAPLERLRGRFRYRVLLRASERAPLRGVARAVEAAIRKSKDRLVRASIDIDPMQML